MGKFGKFGRWGKNAETLAVYGQPKVEEEVKPEVNPLDPYYQNRRSALEQQKTDDLAALDRSRVKQRQEAAINNELLMKYLPQLNKASGLTGLGVAQSANVDALSRYAQNIGNIESNFQQGVSDLERAYRSDSAAIDAEERREVLALRDKEEQEASDRRTRAETVILSGHFENEDALSRYLDAMGFEEGTPERSELEAYASPYIKDEEKVGGTTSVGTVSDTGGTVYVPFEAAEGNAPGGFNLAISAPIQNKDELLGIVGNKDEGEVFAHDGGIYIFKNGAVYALTDKNGSITSRTYSDAYNYLANGTAPETRPMDQMPIIPETQNQTPNEQESSTGYTEVNGTKALRAKLTGVKDNTIVDYNGEKYFKDGTKYYKIVNND